MSMMESRRVAIMIGVALAVAAGIGLLAFTRTSPRGGPPFPALLLAIGVIVVALVAVAITTASRSRQRDAAKRADLCARLDLVHVKSPGKSFLEAYRGLPGVTRSATPRHLFRGWLDGRELTIFQATYHVYTGQTTVPVTHAYFVTDGPDWPQVNILPRRGLRWLLHRLGFSRGLELENPRFNAAYRVETADEDFALTLLSQDMQQFMLEKPDVRWCIRPRRVCLVYRGNLRLDRLERSLERVRGFWSRVPPELEYWRA
jgi:hypothetical protein